MADARLGRMKAMKIDRECCLISLLLKSEFSVSLLVHWCQFKEYILSVIDYYEGLAYYIVPWFSCMCVHIGKPCRIHCVIIMFTSNNYGLVLIYAHLVV